MGHRNHRAAIITAAIVTTLAVPVLGNAQQRTPPRPTPYGQQPAPRTQTPPNGQPNAQPNAQPTTPYVAPGPPGSPLPTGGPMIDPAATNHLNRMAAYLGKLIAFQVKADITREEVMEDGSKVTFGGTAEMVVERPTRMRLSVNSDRQQRLFLFDGANFTIYAPKMKYYAQVPAAGTIGNLIDKLDERFELELPLADFFRWNTPDAFLGNITAAKDMGPAEIEGVTTQHYVLRQNGLDWQIWIQNGDFPLPRKVVLTTTTDEARPQYTAVYTWNLAPSISSDAFAFEAPEGAKKIPMGEVPTALERRER